jgi:hypothetical protein
MAVRQGEDLSRHSAASPTVHILAEGDRTAWLTMQSAATGLHSKFPANREIKGISQNPAVHRDFRVGSAREFQSLQPNSLRNGTGNFWDTYQGQFCVEQGILRPF